MAFRYSPKIVTDGLVLALDAANIKSYPGSGTTWFDLTGNGYNVTLSTENIGTRNIGRMTFTTSSLEYGSIAGGYSVGTSSNAISMWAMCTDEKYFSGSYANSGHIIGSNNKFRNGIWWRFISGFQQEFGLYSETQDNNNQIFGSLFNHDLQLNQMYNIHINTNSGTGSIYINGELKTENGRPTNTLNLDYIGAIPQGTYGEQQRLDGQINIINVWDKPLTSDEILQNYNAVKSRFGL